MRLEGNVASMGRFANASKLLVRKSKKMKLPGRPFRRYENNVTIYHKEVGREAMDCIREVQDGDQ
jgi:hypothetical protein